jgi:hypothetical protein
MMPSKRPLKDRVTDVISPVDSDVVDYFLAQGLLPVTKIPHQMLWDPAPGRAAEAGIASRINDYWLLEAYLAFPEKVAGHTWALIRAVSCTGQHESG